MPRERPILRQHRGPAAAPAPAAPSTGGEDLSNLIAEADALRIDLGYQRWDDLIPLCNGNNPKDLNRHGLVWLIGTLGAMQREKRHG